MSFWEWLDRRWPSERGWVIILLALLIGGLLSMAKQDPTLWRVELFKTLLTAATITGALNMILAFYFAANKSDEQRADLDAQRTENTGKLAELASKALDQGGAGSEVGDAAKGARQATEAAEDVTEQLEEQAGKP